MAFGRATGASAREWANGTRWTTPTRARHRGRARAVRETLELAGALDSVNVDLALSGAEEILGKGAFAATSFAGAVFGSKVRGRRDAREGTWGMAWGGRDAGRGTRSGGDAGYRRARRRTERAGDSHARVGRRDG